MTPPARAVNASSAVFKVFFASIVVALLLSPVLSAAKQERRQDPAQPRIKQRILRVDRREMEAATKAQPAETQQPTQETTVESNVATTSSVPCDTVLFLGDVESVILFAFGYQPNSTVTFTTVQTNPGTVGFAATPAGPFVESHQFPVTMDGAGSGISSPYYVKGLTVGFTSHHDTSPETVFFTSVEYNVIPHCNCPPIPVIP